MATIQETGRYVHLFFMDGVGLGADNPEINPFLRADLTAMTERLGPRWYLRDNGPIFREDLSLIPTDANMGMPGRPQSATGQATILTGRNIPAAVGEHYGPKPNPAVRAQVAQGSIFSEIVAEGGEAALITPYPQGYFDSINSGKRLLSSVPLAATSAGLNLMTAADLAAGRAVSPGFTAQAWRTMLGHAEMPMLTLEEAGQQIATIAATYRFSFFEHWPSDRPGHRGTLTAAAQHLETLFTVVANLISSWDDEKGLLIITSDHGNIEDKSHRNHTTNPVPTILVGPDHQRYARQIHDLSDIVPVVRDYLGLTYSNA